LARSGVGVGEALDVTVGFSREAVAVGTGANLESKRRLVGTLALVLEMRIPSMRVKPTASTTNNHKRYDATDGFIFILLSSVRRHVSRRQPPKGHDQPSSQVPHGVLHQQVRDLAVVQPGAGYIHVQLALVAHGGHVDLFQFRLRFGTGI